MDFSRYHSYYHSYNLVPICYLKANNLEITQFFGLMLLIHILSHHPTIPMHIEGYSVASYALKWYQHRVTLQDHLDLPTLPPPQKNEHYRLMEEIPNNHQECIKPCKSVNNGVNYQPQLVQDFFHQPYETLHPAKTLGSRCRDLYDAPCFTTKCP